MDKNLIKKGDEKMKLICQFCRLENDTTKAREFFHKFPISSGIYLLCDSCFKRERRRLKKAMKTIGVSMTRP